MSKNKAKLLFKLSLNEIEKYLKSHGKAKTVK